MASSTEDNFGSMMNCNSEELINMLNNGDLSDALQYDPQTFLTQAAAPKPESSQVYVDQNAVMASPEQTTGTLVSQNTDQVSNQPYVRIIEQPKSRGLRFRYKCEGRSAGSIPGENSTNEHRTFPGIEICNNECQSAIVVVSCVTKDERARPHPHSLVGQDCSKGVCTIKLKGTNTVSFPNIGIQCTTKRDVHGALQEREKIRVDPFGTSYYQNTGNIDLNVVRLCFQVFLPDKKNKYTRIVEPVVSQPIYDKKALGDLVICRLSRQAGSGKGGDEVFLLCEKVNKDDIQVRFFELSQSGDTVWESYADFSPSDVHHQFAVVFKTPQFRDPYIKSPITVHVQLKRPSDGETSDAKPFQYTPDDPDPDGIKAKKRRKALACNFMQDTFPVPEANRAVDSMTVKQRIKLKATRSRPAAAAGPEPGVQAYSMTNTGGVTQPGLTNAFQDIPPPASIVSNQATRQDTAGLLAQLQNTQPTSANQLSLAANQLPPAANQLQPTDQVSNFTTVDEHSLLNFLAENNLADTNSFPTSLNFSAELMEGLSGEYTVEQVKSEGQAPNG